LTYIFHYSIAQINLNGGLINMKYSINGGKNMDCLNINDFCKVHYANKEIGFKEMILNTTINNPFTLKNDLSKIFILRNINHEILAYCYNDGVFYDFIHLKKLNKNSDIVLEIIFKV